MIYVLCSGGLGNQMFQFAYLKHLQVSGRKAVLDISFFSHHDIHTGYALNKAFGILGEIKPDHFNGFWKAKYALMARCNLKRFGSLHMERSSSLIDENEIQDNAVLYGFWQGEQFFADAKDAVKRSFIFQNIQDEAIAFGERMSNESSVAIHIRRGDYLKNPKYVNLSSTQYYRNAIDIIKSKMPNSCLYIFSDDITWCRESGLFDGATYVDFTKEAHEDMYLMSKAKGIITANSSFSWWAGYLGNHEIVIRPERYLVNWNAEQDKRLFPKEWMIGRFEG